VAIPIINTWEKYYDDPHEGLGSSYERIVLNLLLMRLMEQGGFKSALETPCFGFTGLTGINLAGMAKAGCQVCLEDSDLDRIDRIRSTWQELGIPVQIKHNPGFSALNYADHSFDFGFNFSALWFVADLPDFIREFTRVVRNQILICVPNQRGIGFRGQLKGFSPDQYPQLRPAFIDPPSIIHLMRKCGWKLVEQDFIDCPPWPDIGMNKEDFFSTKLQHKTPEETPEPRLKPISILDYYRGVDPEFAPRMLRLYPFEKYAPRLFKRYWAHHLYLLFQP